MTELLNHLTAKCICFTKQFWLLTANTCVCSIQWSSTIISMNTYNNNNYKHSRIFLLSDALYYVINYNRFRRASGIIEIEIRLIELMF